MAGHNKWSQIKHKKAKTDAQRGKLFSKIAREIMMATKLGGADSEMNPRLRLALQKAKEANMPNDNVNRAIQKGAGGGPEVQLEELQFEAYGPNGIALLIDALTDNRNRTVSNLKAILNKGGANMAQKGSVSYLFETKGLIYFSSLENEDVIVDIAIDAGADDVVTKEDDGIEIITSIELLETIKQSFDEKNITYETATLIKLPKTVVNIDESQLGKVEKLLDNIHEDDDIQDVFTNLSVE